MFSQDLLNEIRDRTPMSTFIGERIQLKKAGRNFKGLCPFHNEKTPSFMVSDEKQIYHCFGCGEGGDIFSFLMKYDGLTFAEAVKSLAERCGVTITEAEMKGASPDAELARKKKWCFRVNQIAMEWFVNRLAQGGIGEQARNYLISRGIKAEISTQLNLGVADNIWDGLLNHLKSRGVPIKLAAELGLLRERSSRDGYYDFFRGRLIFPILSPRGEVIAFGGRVMSGEDDVKYINSPDSMIFHKSMSVYGLNWAAEHIRREDKVLIVEGYMDVIGLIQTGLKNVVAPLGTALTSGHIRLLSRSTRNVVLIFDGDEAGSRAALRSLPIFLEAGLMPRIVRLPDGEDPDSFVQKEGREGLANRISKAESLFEFFIDETVKKTGHDAAGKVKAMSAITPYLKQLKDPVEQGVYRGRVAAKLDIAEPLLRESLGQGLSDAQKVSRLSDHRNKVVLPSAERIVVETVIQSPDLAPRALGELKSEDFADGFSQTIWELLSEHYKAKGRIAISDFLDELADPEMEGELRAIAVSSERVAADEAEKVLSDCIGAMRARAAKENMRKLNDLIRIAEAEGNTEQLYELLRRKKELTNEKFGNQ